MTIPKRHQRNETEEAHLAVKVARYCLSPQSKKQQILYLVQFFYNLINFYHSNLYKDAPHKCVAYHLFELGCHLFEGQGHSVFYVY